jgi:hypothetical protein
MPLKGVVFGPKNAVLGAKIDVFVPKNDQNRRKCFAFYLSNDSSKPHILMIRFHRSMENVHLFGRFFIFCTFGRPQSRAGAAEQEGELPFQTPLCAKGS